MMEEFLSGFLSEWATDAVIDSIKTIPFLFFVFLFIEIFEHFHAEKIRTFLSHSKKEGPVIGAVAASIPQCGFSVVASTLYSKGFITKGTIIASYLATSDEALPVLFMYPEYLPFVLPLILIKLMVAIPLGYLTDLIFKSTKNEPMQDEHSHIEGCCKHNITVQRKRDFLFHPIKHTFGIFVFILILTLILNYLLESADFKTVFEAQNPYLSSLLSSIIGLIPNCAVSVGLVLMFVKGTITFGTMVSGLMTSSGIGLLVLFKNNKDKKDLAIILSILVLTGFLTGAGIHLVQNFKVL